MKKIMLLTAVTLFNAAHAEWHWVQQIDNQSSCTLQLIEHTQTLDATTHNAPSTIPPHSEGFIETTGKADSQYVNSYAVICNQQQVGIGQIFDNNLEWDWDVSGYTSLFFYGDGISWDYYRSYLMRAYPSYVVVKNK